MDDKRCTMALFAIASSVLFEQMPRIIRKIKPLIIYYYELRRRQGSWKVKRETQQ